MFQATLAILYITVLNYSRTWSTCSWCRLLDGICRVYCDPLILSPTILLRNLHSARNQFNVFHLTGQFSARERYCSALLQDIYVSHNESHKMVTRKKANSTTEEQYQQKVSIGSLSDAITWMDLHLHRVAHVKNNVPYFFNPSA